MHRKMGSHRMETTLGEGRESAKGNHMEYPMVEGDSPFIQRTDEGRIYSDIFTTDKDLRAKHMASKHLYAKHYTILLLRVAYTVSMLCNTLLQPPYRKNLAIY